MVISAVQRHSVEYCTATKKSPKIFKTTILFKTAFSKMYPKKLSTYYFKVQTAEAMNVPAGNIQRSTSKTLFFRSCWQTFKLKDSALILRWKTKFDCPLCANFLAAKFKLRRSGDMQIMWIWVFDRSRNTVSFLTCRLFL